MTKDLKETKMILKDLKVAMSNIKDDKGAKNMPSEILLTLEQVAERLAVSRKMVFDWVRAGKIPGVKLGRLWRVKQSALDEFINSLETVGPNDDQRGPDREEDADEGR